MSNPTFDRGRPSTLRRAFFKSPIRLYHGPVADVMKSRCVMLLTTTGRKSGEPRTTGVSFMQDGENLVVFSGWGVRSDWYQNLLVHPEVRVQVGTDQFTARAEPVFDPERRKELMLRMQANGAHCGPPEPMRSILKMVGVFDYDAELRLAVEQAGELPVVELVPVRP